MQIITTTLIALLLAWAAVGAESRSMQAQPTLKIRVIHVNDLHAHIEQSSVDLIRCRPDMAAQKTCFGGAARMFTKINQLRHPDPEHTLVLNAGDYYQGTIWYSVFKYAPILEFSNIMNFTAMGLGNHDFDDGIDGLIPFAAGANFAMLAANLNASAAPELAKRCSKSLVVHIDGRKIGIIGYVIQSTDSISSPGDKVSFLDEIESVRLEAKRLKDEEDVTILIALGHAGYELDKRMAKEVPELDLVVGGHSHTFLYSGDNPPSIEKPEGPYPTYVVQDHTNRVVPVVQAFCYSKYLGYLELHFDQHGELMSPVASVGVKNAQPILLDSTVAEDEDVLHAMDKYRGQMEAFTVPVGVLAGNLTKDRLQESSLGNFLTDTMVHAWSGQVSIALLNGGGIRTDLQAGNFTTEDILYVLPFNNTVDKIIVPGQALRQMLESAVAGLCPNQTCYSNPILQVSGLRIVFLIRDDNVGSRIQSILTPCLHDSNRSGWCDLEDARNYSVAVPSYLANGGTRKCKLNCVILDRTRGMLDYEAVKLYAAKFSPISAKVEGRMTFFYHGGRSKKSAFSSTWRIGGCLNMIGLIVSVVLLLTQ